MKNKKVIIVGVVVVVLLILCFVLFGGGNEGDDWDEALLSDYLPEVEEGTLSIGINSEEELSVSVKDPGTKYYKEYKDKCIKKGYTVDPKKEDDKYTAYNKDGYKLELLHYSSGDFHIRLYAPEEMSEFTWPSNGAGAKLPKTESNYGKIESNSSNGFGVLVGKTTKEDYDNYVSECEKAGFNLNFDKKDDSYYAKSSDGYSVTLTYEGNNIMHIVVNHSTGESNNNNSDEKPSNNSNGIRSDFKKAMDSYEKFMDEYVAFMKKYKNSNGSDLSLLQEYNDYLTKYTDFVNEFNEWDSKDLNDAEAKYYIEVQTRVNKKLLEI